DTWIDPRDVDEEEAPTTLEGVNTRVTELAAVQEQDTQDIHRVMEDTQGRQTEIFQRVEALPAAGQPPPPEIFPVKFFRQTPKYSPSSRSIQPTTCNTTYTLAAAGHHLHRRRPTTAGTTTTPPPLVTTPPAAILNQLTTEPPTSPAAATMAAAAAYAATFTTATPLTPATTAGATATAVAFPAAAAAVAGCGWQNSHHRRGGANINLSISCPLFHAWWLQQFCYEIFN
nr:hypothetical protein [Tanacetum cinerariifolium]